MVLFPTLLNGLARNLSIKNNKSKNNIDEDELGKEAADSLVKHARRLELISRSSGTLNSNRSSNLISICSKKGEKGINQDCLIVWEEFGCQEDMTLCGIFDGHGEWGHIIAKKVRESLPSSLLCSWQQTLVSLDNFMDCQQQSHNDKDHLNTNFQVWKQSYLKTYASIDQQLKYQRGIDSFRSGTTALTVVKQGESLVIANVGDSRAVLATTSEDGSLVPLQLTVDFKPNLPQEAERIKESRGRVFCLRDEPGVYRVWMPNDKSPGLALSRAFGDYCVKDFGLIAVPDVTHRFLSSNDHFLILATDGVWDVISNKEAVEIVSSTKSEERGKAAKRLVYCAVKAWKSKKRGIAMDDMSAICLFFNHHPPPSPTCS